MHTAAAFAPRLRQDLLDAGYTIAQLRELFGPRAEAALEREQFLPALTSARERPGPGATLARLFLLGDAVTTAELMAALPRTGAEVIEAGLVAPASQDAPRSQDLLHAAVDLRPVDLGAGEFFLTSDVGESTTGAAIETEHVLGAGWATRTLAELTVRTPVHRALDLGTGSGIQALGLSTLATSVVATDISVRTLEFSAFNAALNGIALGGTPGQHTEYLHDGAGCVGHVSPGVGTGSGGSNGAGSGAGAGSTSTGPTGVADPTGTADPSLADGAGVVELRRGSLLQPVAGEQFDLVVSNPPFVITPRGSDALPEYTYRDAGGTGDEMARGLVTGLRPHLAPGGIAQMLLNWEIRDLQDPFARVLQWCRDSGLDAWIIGRDVSDPCEYAETWLRDGGITPERDRKAWERGYHAWVADFDRRGVLAVGFGYLILHRPQRADQEQWLRAEQITTRPPGALGGAIAATLEAKDALAHLDEAALADCALTVAGDVTEERHYRPGSTDPEVILLHQGGGFGRSVRADTALAAVVGTSDGELTVAQIAAGVAALTDTEPQAVLESVLPDIRGLILDGFLRLPGYRKG